MFVEVDTDSGGVAILLRGLAELNIHDCLENPALERELFRRLGGKLLYYRTEQMGDVWSTIAAEAWRDRQRAKGPHEKRRRLSRICGDGTCGVGDAWGQDCEEFAAECACAAILLARRKPEMRAQLLPVEVCVTQPKVRGIAHAYNRIGGVVVDWAVRFGMREPPPGFYDGPETAAMLVGEPKFSLFRRREVTLS